MLNNISKLTANLSADSKANKLGLPNCDNIASECSSPVATLALTNLS